MKRKSWIAILSILVVLTLVIGLSLGSTSKALSGSEKVDTGAVGTHTVGWVTVTIAGHEPTYVASGYITAPAGCTVTGGTVSVKGGTGTNTYTFTGSSFSGPLYAPKNNGGNVADVSHVTVVYYYECPTPTPTDPATPTPTDPATPTPTSPATPTPKPSEPPIPGRG